MPKTLNKKMIGVMMLCALVAPQAAGAAAPTGGSYNYQAPPLLAQDTEAQLLAAGCQQIKLADTPAIEAALAINRQAVVASDAGGETLMFCPTGAVKAWFDGPVKLAKQAASSLINWGEGTARAAYDRIDSLNGAPISGAVVTAEEWLLEIFIGLIPRLLTEFEFTDNSVVQATWPRVLLAVNGGFMLVLIIIALLTVLRVESGGARRLLPRLLLAALLVNFSLVICGILIDISRVVMAVESVFLGLPNLDRLSFELYDNAQIWQQWENLEKMFRADVGSTFSVAIALSGLDDFIKNIIQILIMTVLLVSTMIVVVMLVVRKIALILLITISPLAYVLLVLPSTAPLAKKWWSLFLRYLIYAPVVLAILLLAAGGLGVVNDALGLFDIDCKSGAACYKAKFMAYTLNTVMWVAFFIFAAMAGKWAGVVGSSMMINMATRGAKRTGRAAAVPFRNFAGDFSRVAGGRARGRLGKIPGLKGLTVKRDSKGKPMKGQPLTPGERLAGLGSKDSGLARRARKATDRNGNLRAGDAAKVYAGTGDYGAKSLRNTRMKQALGMKGVGGVVGAINPASSHGMAQMSAILNDKKFTSSLSDDDQVQLETIIINKINSGSVATGDGFTDDQKQYLLRKAASAFQSVDQSNNP